MTLRKIWVPALLYWAGFSLGTVPTTLHAQAHKQIMGRTENALILPERISLRAKLDSGAKTSSLHAPHIIFFERAGKRWVRFTVTGKKGPLLEIEKEVVRIAKIKRHKGPSVERPVIVLGICLGRVYRKVEVNLVDRGRFNYFLLIGRNFMAGEIVIDPELRFTTKPDCEP